MKAFEIQEFGIDKLVEVERDIPSPADGEVMVKLHAASLNYRDVMVVSGTYNPRMWLPAIPLSDAAGEIVEVGTGVTKWKVGDRICSCVIPGWVDDGPSAEKSKTAIGAGGSDGVVREYATFAEDAVVAAPVHLSLEEASTLPCAAVTAWHALTVSGGVKPGDTVLTLGTGGVSVFAVQFAKARGARVISTSSSDEKLARIRDLGSDETINYRVTPDWDKAVLELTEGRGVDHVIEVGGTGTLTRSVKAVRIGGHIALIGALDMAGEFNPIPIFMKGIRMQGIFVGSREMFVQMNAFIEENKLRPVIDREFAFDEIRDALHYMASGAHLGKIVVRY
ncbi:MAG TPA: NAD(P)-dependent alcohol dehydrogenase [Pyrinomonadaceae bacterium]|jgi:NADPH:quinone reductase-like Zn-dependent oxidoreductase|nr:NAD(P)-dependent alcohol dehydrogenase [Pyrinomonadaceae bacterium]